MLAHTVEILSGRAGCCPVPDGSAAGTPSADRRSRRASRQATVALAAEASTMPTADSVLREK
jgi:hypothetical protein